MRIVVALGGNALLRRGEPLEAEFQRRNVDVAAMAIAGLAEEHEIIVTHGNGPQVGLLALQAEAYPEVEPYPLDVLGAESQGMIGYLLLEGLAHLLPSREVAGVLTRVVVDEDDPAFAHPTKPVGPHYSEKFASTLARERGWTVARDGSGWRRVVASPEPRDVLDLPVIRLLADAGVTVICGGGGGIPLTGSGANRRGIEGVIDKDLTSVLIAFGLGADCLMFLTDVQGVARGWGTEAQTFMDVATPGALRKLKFDKGSMGPKVEAACRFVEISGMTAAIGSLSEAKDVLAGTSGTRIVVTRQVKSAGRNRAA